MPVLLVGGVHGREIALPPALLNFAEDLIQAYVASRAITVARFTDSRPPSRDYPEFVIPWPEVRRIVDRLDLFILPLANPDGRHFVLSSPANADWRKNRRPAPPGATCTPAAKRIGVDLNRNFDIAWDINTYYSATAAASAGISDIPCNDVYRGPSPTGAMPREEPEVRNIQHLINDKKIKFYVDLHSYGRKILYPWAIEDNQTIDATKNFQNTAWNRGGASGERDGYGHPAYGEYFPNSAPDRLLDGHITLGRSMRDSIRNHAGTTYEQPAQTGSLSAAFGNTGDPGGSDDYAFSRQFVAGVTPPPVFSYTLEFGHADDQGFSPHPTIVYPKIEREVFAALKALLGYAAGWRAPASGSGCSGGCDNCFIATAALESDRHPDVVYLRDLRDCVLKKTKRGQWFMGLLEPTYYSFSPPFAAYLRKTKRLRAFIRTAVVKPAVWQIRFCELLARRIVSSERRVDFLVYLIAGLCAGNIALATVLFYCLIRMLFKSLV